MDVIVEQVEGWPGPVHPAAEIFPLMQGDEFAELVQDIKANGLLEWVWVTPAGELLDGRNRVRACIAAGVAVQSRVYEGDDPVAFAISLNLKRRHLTTGQRAAIAADLVPVYATEGLRRMAAGGAAAAPGKPAEKGFADLQNLSTERHNSAQKAADAVGVSARAVSQFKRVEEAAPELADKVRMGEVALDRAEREVKTLEARAREKTRKEESARIANEGTRFEIRRGEFQSVLADLAPGSVDLIITDPPYGDNFTHLYGDLAQFANDKLKPGGSCVAYVGQANLPGVLDQMQQHLRYWWTLALIHKHGGQQLPGKWIMVEWKPLIWFVKDHRSGKVYVADRMAGSKPRKDLHEWAQGVDEIAYLIERLTEAGGLVVDPFAGSGSFGYAAKELGRHFIGAESGQHKDAR